MSSAAPVSAPCYAPELSRGQLFNLLFRRESRMGRKGLGSENHLNRFMQNDE